MTCFNPLTGFVLINRLTEKGKKIIIFNESEVKGKQYTKIDLPCGQCIGCRIDKTREWAIRSVHEASMFEKNCFITLTYNDDNINDNGSLVLKDFQDFMKRLRRKYAGFECMEDDKGKKIYPIRFIHCGEYGSSLKRPHYHACIFNFDFPDKEYWKEKGGYRWYVSEELAKLWDKGYHVIGDVTYESAAYVAQYITKKITGGKASEHYKTVRTETGEIIERRPEYCTMSRRPGIGKRWFEKFGKTDVFPKDFITCEGRIVRTPKYYDKIYDETNKREFEKIKRKRKENAYRTKEERKMSRLLVQHKVANAKLRKQERSLENGVNIMVD